MLYLVIFYLTAKYGPSGGFIGSTDFMIGVLVGALTVGAFLSIGPTWLFPKIMHP
jgi:hypothetical protein